MLSNELCPYCNKRLYLDSDIYTCECGYHYCNCEVSYCLYKDKLEPVFNAIEHMQYTTLVLKKGLY
jgi:hypothetical protein